MAYKIEKNTLRIEEGYGNGAYDIVIGTDDTKGFNSSELADLVSKIQPLVEACFKAMLEKYKGSTEEQLGLVVYGIPSDEKSIQSFGIITKTNETASDVFNKYNYKYSEIETYPKKDNATTQDVEFREVVSEGSINNVHDGMKVLHQAFTNSPIPAVPATATPKAADSPIPTPEIPAVQSIRSSKIRSKDDQDASLSQKKRWQSFFPREELTLQEAQKKRWQSCFFPREKLILQEAQKALWAPLSPPTSETFKPGAVQQIVYFQAAAEEIQKLDSLLKIASTRLESNEYFLETLITKNNNPITQCRAIEFIAEKFEFLTQKQADDIAKIIRTFVPSGHSSLSEKYPKTHRNLSLILRKMNDADSARYLAHDLTPEERAELIKQVEKESPNDFISALYDSGDLPFGFRFLTRICRWFFSMLLKPLEKSDSDLIEKKQAEVSKNAMAATLTQAATDSSKSAQSSAALEDRPEEPDDGGFLLPPPPSPPPAQVQPAQEAQPQEAQILDQLNAYKTANSLVDILNKESLQKTTEDQNFSSTLNQVREQAQGLKSILSQNQRLSEALGQAQKLQTTLTNLRRTLSDLDLSSHNQKIFDAQRILASAERQLRSMMNLTKLAPNSAAPLSAVAKALPSVQTAAVASSHVTTEESIWTQIWGTKTKPSLSKFVEDWKRIYSKNLTIEKAKYLFGEAQTGGWNFDFLTRPEIMESLINSKNPEILGYIIEKLIVPKPDYLKNVLEIIDEDGAELIASYIYKKENPKDSTTYPALTSENCLILLNKIKSENSTKGSRKNNFYNFIGKIVILHRENLS